MNRGSNLQYIHYVNVALCTHIAVFFLHRRLKTIGIVFTCDIVISSYVICNSYFWAQVFSSWSDILRDIP